jgi:hypothetical protein
MYALCHDSGDALVTSRVEGKKGFCVDRCALFVDAGYVLADGAMAVHGTRQRDSVSWDHAGLIKLLTGLSRDRTGLPVLRCYWYEAIVDGQRSSEHDTLADLPGLKLRLSRMRPGRREGVEAEMQRDLTTLARNHAVSDAVIVSAEEDLAEVVAEVQDFGMRVTIIHIMGDGDWTVSKPLRQECDDIVEISGAHLRPFVDLIPGAEPSVHDGQFQNGSYPRQNHANANGNGVGAGAMTHQNLPAAALPPGPTMYTAPVMDDYQRAAGQMPSAPPSMPAAPAAGPDTGPQPGGRRGGGRAAGARGGGQATGPQRAGRRGAGARGGGARAADAQGGGQAEGPQPAGVPAGPQAVGMPVGLAGAPTDPQIMGMPGPPSGPHPVMSGPPTDPHAVMPGPPTGPHAVMPGPPSGPHQVMPGPPTGPHAAMPGPPTGPHAVMPGVGPPSRPNLARPPGPQPMGPPAPAPYPQGPLPSGPAAPVAGLPALPAGPSAYPGPMPGEQAAAPGGPGYGPGPSLPDPRGARNSRRAPRAIAAGGQGQAAPQPPMPGGQPYPQPSMPQAAMPQPGPPQGPMPQMGMPQPSAGPGPMPPGPMPQAGMPPPAGPGPRPPGPMPQAAMPPPMPQPGPPQAPMPGGPGDPQFGQRQALPGRDRMGMTGPHAVRQAGGRFADSSAPYPPAPPGQFGSAGPPPQQFYDAQAGPPAPGYPPRHEQGPYGAPQPGGLAPMPQAAPQPMAVSVADAVQSAHAEGFSFGDAVARDAPALWLEAVLARKPRMPSDLEARLLQGSALPIDSLLHDEVRHSLRRGFWDALERSRR